MCVILDFNKQILVYVYIMGPIYTFSGITEFGDAALHGRPGIKISSMCTVFAESEAVSLLHRGAPRNDIALALHAAAVVERTCGMLQRVGFEQPLVFTGGVANNHCMVKLLAAKLVVKVMVPQEPQHGSTGRSYSRCSIGLGSGS